MKNLTIQKIFTFIMYLIAITMFVTNIYDITNFDFLNIWLVAATPAIASIAASLLFIVSFELEKIFDIFGL